MSWTTWSVVLAALGATQLVRGSRAASRERGAATHARRLRLPLPDAVREAVAMRLGARWRAEGAGLLVGAALLLVTGLAVAGALPSPEDGAAWVSAVPFVVLVLAPAVASVASALREAPRPPADGPRLARAPRPTAADYVHPTERVLPRWLVAGSAVGGVVLAAVAGPGAATAPLVVLAAAVVLLLAAEAAQRAVLERPQPAASTEELAWDDALRALAMRQAATGACLGAGLTVVVTALAWVRAVAASAADAGLLAAGEADAWAAAASALVVLAALVLALASTAVRPASHVVRRLRPQRAAAVRAAVGAQR